MCACVRARVCVRAWSRSKSISMVLSQISRAVCVFFFFFSFPPNPKIKGSSHKKKIENLDFLKNGTNDFNKIFWVYSTFETQQHDPIDFSQKNPWN